MFSLYNIRVVARYEMKVLWRSWFFRIFSGIALGFITLMTIGILARFSNAPWALKGIPSMIPYMNIKLLNVAQAIIAIFLASDFLKRDKKADTTEVVYMRSIDNMDYVFGKTIAVIFMFLALNFVLLSIAFIIHFFFSDTFFNIYPYLLYPLYISLPTLIFVVGLAYILMLLTRNQAVTTVLLLGYAGTVLFFLRGKVHSFFDFFAFQMPFMFSDITGFGNLKDILLLRGFYVIIGLSFIFLTALYLRRLPQSRWTTQLAAVCAIIGFAISAFMASSYLRSKTSFDAIRTTYRQLNEKYAGFSYVSITNCDLNIQHQGHNITGKAALVFSNTTDQPIREYLFTLNPGLSVTKITRQGKSDFKQNHHLIFITPEQPLAPGETDSLSIYYEGQIADEFCYLDIDDKTVQQPYRVFFHFLEKRYSFLTPYFVCLTPEATWYPVAGLTYGANYPKLRKKDFINFELTVETDNKLVALSSGELRENETTDNRATYHFVNEHALPQISLIIGKYASKSIEVDSVTYSVYYRPGHDYFSQYFTETGDTLSALIREERNDFEGKIGLTYPFNRLSLIEVPIQFNAHSRLWTLAQEVVQPEQILVPEFGLYMQSADFANAQRRSERRLDSRNQTETPAETQSQMFKFFLRQAFLESTSGFRFSGLFSSAPPNYSILPNYYYHITHFSSENWPVFNTALEAYFDSRAQDEEPPFFRNFVGLTDAEKANIALQNNSLAQILQDSTQKDVQFTALKTKGEYLFTFMENQLGEQNFRDFILNLMKQNQFNNIDVTYFVNAIKTTYDYNFESSFENWYTSEQLPGYLVDNVEGYKVLDRDRTRFQVKLRMTNASPLPGVITLHFRSGGRGRFFRPETEEDIKKRILLNGNETKDIGVLLDQPVRGMTIDTHISLNLPATLFYRFEDEAVNQKATPFDGEKTVDEPVSPFDNPDEIIVDNEDSTFSVLGFKQDTFLKRFISSRFGSSKDDEKYIGFFWWDPPNRWRATTNSDYLGEFIHSAHYIKSGDGEKKVAWRANLTENGNYDVYFYLQRTEVRSFGPGGRRENPVENLNYYVYHDDGVEHIDFRTGSGTGGWNYLGSFYFSSGETKVELSDESEGRLVVADAVKWVKR